MRPATILRPLAALAALALVAAAAAPARAAPTETEIAFDGPGGFRLSGTLTLPEDASPDSPAPAMLLLPGSGPTDRDGNQPPMLITNLLQRIAQGLADAGVASLRFDKRSAHAYRDAWPPADDIPRFFAYDNFVGDVAAAFDTLRAHDAVDGARVGILGHSQGGLYALEIAAARSGRDDQPATLVLAATAGRPLDDVIREQVRAQFVRIGMDETLREDWLGRLDRALEQSKRGEELDRDEIPVPLLSLFNPSVSVLLEGLLSADPTALAADVRAPTLVIQGDMDAQVSVERDLPPLVDALQAREGVETKSVVVENASHNLKRSAGEGDPGFTGPVMEPAMEAIVGWARRTLRAE